MRLITVITALVLAGCATGPQLTPEQRSAMLQPVVCADKVQCDLYWQRAQLWVAQHSHWRIQLANDVLIQTYGPGNSSPDTAYTITRINAANGSGQIKMRAACDNIFGCIPAPVEAIDMFRKEVMETSSATPPPSPPAPKKLKFGVQMAPVSEKYAAELHLKGPTGAVVVAIEPNSVADLAGIIQGDIIVEMSGSPIKAVNEVQQLVTGFQPGQKVELTILRAGQRKKMVATF